MENSKLIFTGHFDVGEKPNDNILTLVEEAKNIEGDIVVLAGDIGVEERLVAYITKGIRGIVDIYNKREFSCKSSCILEQLPKNNQIENIIDIEFFEKTADYVKKDSPGLYKSILNGTFNEAKLIKILNEKIIPEEIEKRLSIYNFENRNLWLVKEKNLRNIVTKRTKKKTQPKKTWRVISDFHENYKGTFINGEMIKNEKDIPLCRGIMFAFYEKVLEKGYNSIVHLVENRHYRSIKKGLDLFLEYYQELPYIKGLLEGKFIKMNNTMKKLSKDEIYKIVAERNQQRFETHRDYIIEKLTKDDFVSKAIIELSVRLKKHIEKYKDYYINLKSINLVDIGPAHGAIGTCYALAVLDEYDLLEKVKLTMIDPVESVLSDNKNLNFPVKDSFEIIMNKLYKHGIVNSEELPDISVINNIFSKSKIFAENIQDLDITDEKNQYDILIHTFTMHHIHPDHKTDAMQKSIDLLKTEAFFGFADEWFQDEYFERFIKGRDHINDPIPFEFPESPEDAIEHFQRRISIFYLIYDGKEAYTITGIKRKKEEKWKTGHFPDYNYEDLI